MKISPIINLLASTLPTFTDRFSNTLAITSITAAAGVATVTTTAPHLLNPADTVTITDAVQTVSIVSLTVLNGVGTIRTAQDHGMVLGFDFKTRGGQTILRIRGSSNPLLNVDFNVLSVPNRFYVSFATTLANGTYTTDGSVLNYAYNAFNGVHTVITTPTPTTFTYVIASSFSGSTAGPSVLHSFIRITGAADLPRAEANYTNYEQAGYTQNKYYAYVTPGSSTASKSRNMLNDSIATFAPGTDYRVYIVEDFDVNIFCPTSNDLLGITTRDAIEDIKVALFSTLLGIPQPAQYTTVNTFLLVFVSDFVIQFDRPNLIHGFKFQTMYEINQSDINKFGDLAPFRTLGMGLEFGDVVGSKIIDLDVDPAFSG